MIRDLSCACVDMKPRDIDWQDAGDDEWDSWEAVECDLCHEKLVLNAPDSGNEKHRHLADCDCDGFVDLSEGPMMSYWYPLGISSLRGNTFDPRDAAKKIAHLPLCIVRVGDEYGLALTGGGMDFSWEIASAFVALGYLPPTHFELPAMCGRGTSAKDRMLLKAYRRSCVVQIRWLRQRMRSSKTIPENELERVRRNTESRTSK